MIQIAIAILSCLSVMLFSTKKYFKYGFIVGIISQPLWLYSTYASEQWGMFIGALIYTLSHLNGIRNNFYDCKTK
jgi:hypothetical protein